jgi:hypothetical protein
LPNTLLAVSKRKALNSTVKKIINWYYLPFSGFGIGDSVVAGIYSGLRALRFSQMSDRLQTPINEREFSGN